MVKKTYTRWYENNAELNKSVNLLVTFDAELLEIMVNSFNTAFNDVFEAEKNNQKIKSLGLVKTTGLHKSKQRRRKYDENPFLHGFMQKLYILTDESLMKVAPTIYELTLMVYTYVNQTPPGANKHAVIENVVELCRKYFDESQYSAWEFLETLKLLASGFMVARKKTQMSDSQAIKDGRIRVV